MSEILFTDYKGKVPNLSDVYYREFTARGETVTALVQIIKKDGELIITLEKVNKKNMIRFGGKEKVTEDIQKRIIEKNYDLLIDEGESMALVI